MERRKFLGTMGAASIGAALPRLAIAEQTPTQPCGNRHKLSASEEVS